MKNKVQIFFCIIITLALCASISLSALALDGQKKTTAAVEAVNQTVKTSLSGETQDVNQEDDVTIAGEYVIKSTTQISDAYISGDTSALDDAGKETLDMAKAVLDEVITDKMTDFEKEKAIYEWLTSKLTSSTGILTVIPTGDGECDNPHDVLKYHSAVCVGYATTFRMFMQMLGIECKVVHSSDLTHSWDLVKLDDGCWYHTDCYSDNESSNYHNFNMDDNRCSQSHNWTREYFPAANGTKYNYILSICDELENIYSIPEWVAAAVSEKKNVISCTFKQEINEKNENKAQYMVEQTVEQFNMVNDSYSFEYDWMLNDKSQYVLCFYITKHNNGGAQVDEKTAEKISRAISKAVDKLYSENAMG